MKSFTVSIIHTHFATEENGSPLLKIQYTAKKNEIGQNCKKTDKNKYILEELKLRKVQWKPLKIF
jgi:hypothetical protein